MIEATAERQSSDPHRAWFRTTAIIICEISVFAFAISGIVARHADPAYPGWKCRLSPPIWVVKEVDRHGPAVALRPGDQLIGVNGTEPGWLGPAFKLMDLKPGQPYSLTIRRGTQTVSLRLLMGSHASVVLLDVEATLLFAFLLCLAGLVIRLGGQNDVTARLGNTCFFLGGMAWVGPVLLTYPGWSVPTTWLAVALARLPRPLQMSVGWDFLSRFPHPLPERLPVKVLRSAFYVSSIVLWALFNLPVFAELVHLPYSSAFRPLQWLGRDGPFATSADAAFDGVVGAAAFFVLMHNYRRIFDWDSRRRIRWVAVSFGVGALSLVCLRSIQLAASIAGGERLQTAEDVAEAATTVAMGLIPVALVYAGLKHRVLGIRLVIRRGLQYLLAKNVLRIVLLTPVLIVLVDVIRAPERSFSDLFLRSSWHFYVPVMLTAALSLRYRHQVGRWLDRRFFRVAMQEEEFLVAMTESIRTATTEDEIARAAERQIERALAADGVRIFFRSASSGELESGLSREPLDSQPLEHLLERHRLSASAKNSSLTAPLIVYDRAPPDQAFADPRELLVVPLIGTDGRTFGAFVLGPKKSEQAYTRRERELLQAIGAQVVMACEVLRLKRTVDRESRQRVTILGRLERESIRLLHECPQCGDCYDTSQSHCPRDGETLQLTLPVERLVSGRYELNRRLGAGGMGVVYEAVDTRLDKRVALKIMVGQLFGNQEALLRFKREAHAVASLAHRNIVGMHDFGELPAGGAFLVMDLVRGTSWRSHLRQNKPLLANRVAGWIEGLCEGAAAAHRCGIVHRDLKPENVMLSEGPDGETAMILDFGIAKLQPGFESTSVNVSVDGLVLGTRAYMSPEQRIGEPVGSASDLYSIAVMALETLARSAPPASGATTEWANHALQHIVKPGSQLQVLFSAALLPAPEDRMKPVDQFGRSLAAAIRTEQPLAYSVSGSDEAETQSLGTIT
jgi:tRNA A-37 threonylcarbamoyl transferase component Bud32